MAITPVMAELTIAIAAKRSPAAVDRRDGDVAIGIVRVAARKVTKALVGDLPASA